jgi:hypothetical protein
MVAVSVSVMGLLTVIAVYFWLVRSKPDANAAGNQFPAEAKDA